MTIWRARITRRIRPAAEDASSRGQRIDFDKAPFVDLVQAVNDRYLPSEEQRGEWYCTPLADRKTSSSRRSFTGRGHPHFERRPRVLRRNGRMSLGAGARRKLARVGAVRIHRKHLGLGLALAGLEGKIGGVEQPLRSCRRVGGHGASAQDRRKAKRDAARTPFALPSS